MKFNYHFIAILLSALSLQGCNTQNIKRVEYKQDIVYKYPAISLYNKYPSPELEKECVEFDKESVLHHCNGEQLDFPSIRQALEGSNLFQKVNLGDSNTDYSVSITALGFNLEDASELANAAISGASLLLIPLQTSRDIKSEFQVRWRGHPIKQYAYDLPLVNSVSLLNTDSVEEQNEEYLNALISYFLRDTQNDNVFSGEFLAEALGASDYNNDLILPERVNDYFLEGRYIFPDPYLGAQIRYQHGVISSFVDVYVYPIKNIEWSNVEKVLESEATIVKKEIELMQKQNALSHVVFSDNEWLDIKTESVSKKGVRFSTTWLDSDERDFISLSYLFIIKDKIIKFRITKQDADVKFDIDPFVQTTLSTIELPDESLFMATVRQNYRKKSFNIDESH